MNKREAYLILLGFITENCKDKDEEFMLSVALETLSNEVDEKQEEKQPMIDKDLHFIKSTISPFVFK